MADTNISQEKKDITFLGTGLTIAVLLLPVLSPKFFSLYFMVPLPVFYLFSGYGQQQGTRCLGTALIVAGIIALFNGTLSGLFASFTMLPLAFYLAQAVDKKETYLKTGTTAILLLLFSWIGYGIVYGVVHHMNPYKEILQALSQGVAASFAIYQESSDLSEQTLGDIKQAFQQLERLVPLILPAIITICAIFTVWFNMTAGNKLLKRKDPSLAPWQDFDQWRLPDQLVWPVIAVSLGIMLPESLLQKISLNGVLVLGTLYFFQGLAVLANLFNKWSVPRPFRIFVYVMVFVQAYGFILLCIAGLADIWLDFRKNNNPGDAD